MRIAENVTFGGSGLEREGELRAQPERITELWRDPGCRVLPLWRGKPLVAGKGRERLGWLRADHAVVGLAREPAIFLGRDGEGSVFAVDISFWTPPDLDAAALAAFFDPSEQHHPDLPADHRFTDLRRVMTQLTPRDAELAATARALIGWHRSHRYCSRCGAMSEMAEAGWRRSCPECGAHHFPRSDPVVIMLVVRGNRLLLGRSPAWPEGMYSLLAGFVEPGETIEAAVRREVAEEAGIRVGTVRYLASQPWPFPASLMIGCLAQAESDEIMRDPHELDDALWMTREELVAVLSGRHAEVKGAREGAIAHFLIRNWLADRLD